MKKIMTMALLAIALVSCNAQTSVKEKLATATKEGKTVLMVVSDKNNPSANLKTLAQSATASEKNIAIIEMDKDSEANSTLVNEYRIGSAPMPLLLVFSNKGLLLSGMTEEQATKEAIIDALPTPKYSEISYALSQAKPVFALISNTSFKSDKDALALCSDAKSDILNGAEIIEIDAKDETESKLLTMLNIKTKLKDSYIVAINGQGIMSGRFDKLPSKDELIEAATKVVQSGCAPGGCTPSCQ